MSVKSFIGSLIAIVVGVLTMLGGLRPPVGLDSLVGGATMILGAMAYRSAKRRRLGLKPETALRRNIEIGLLLVVFSPVPLLAMKGVEVWTTHLVSGIVVPLWSLIAYVWILRRELSLAETPSIR